MLLCWSSCHLPVWILMVWIVSFGPNRAKMVYSWNKWMQCGGRGIAVRATFVLNNCIGGWVTDFRSVWTWNSDPHLYQGKFDKSINQYLLSSKTFHAVDDTSFILCIVVTKGWLQTIKYQWEYFQGCRAKKIGPTFLEQMQIFWCIRHIHLQWNMKYISLLLFLIAYH